MKSATKVTIPNKQSTYWPPADKVLGTKGILSKIGSSQLCVHCLEPQLAERHMKTPDHD
jgi:hypothetical protein